MKSGSKIIALAGVALMLSIPAQRSQAADNWKAVQVEKGDPKKIFKETRLPAESEIPGMLTAAASPAGDLEAAWYALPRARFPSGDLGETPAAGALVVRMKGGRKISYQLPEYKVFKDIAPRLADLDGDGFSEVVTIVATEENGAKVAIFAVMGGDALVEKAGTPFLGKGAWLNVAGIERYFGTQTPEVAFVARPHDSGQLAFIKFVRGSLRTLVSKPGFSNHVAGSAELRLSASADVDGNGTMELALPSADRMKLRILALKRTGIVELASVDLPSPVTKGVVAEGTGQDAAFVAGLEDDTVWRISR